MTTPAAITAKETTATVIFTGLLENCSPNSQTLKTMLAKGLTTTRIGWDTLSGPTCRAACSSTVPAIPAPISAYTGQRMSMPGMPNAVSVSVAAFRNVASIAQVRPATTAKTAALRIGEPVRPNAVSTTIAPPNTSTADSHCLVSGVVWPPVGSAAMRNTARDTQTTTTDTQAAAAIRW